MLKTAILGVGGYTGLELVKILLNHPKFKLSYLANTSGNQTISDIHPSLTSISSMQVEKIDAKKAASNDVVFLALPHMQSAKYVKEITTINKDIIIIDLSADYRLDLQTYEKHYCKHIDANNLNRSIYALSDINKEQIKGAKLIANPGCYPTATLLALLPFADYFNSSSDIFVDAKSGISGAGKEPNALKTFVNIDSNCFAYNTFQHRHSPEINLYMQKFGNYNQDNAPHIHFSPHILPIKRGMLISAYAKINKNIDAYEVLSEYYKNTKFVRVFKNGVYINNVVGTNFCDIYAKCENGVLFVCSVIDNLLKGASSSAVVNANISCGFQEDLGINSIAYVP